MRDKDNQDANSSPRQGRLTRTVQHPLTLYPTAFGILGVVALSLFGVSIIPASVALGGFGIGLGSWMINYFMRGDKFDQAAFAQLQRELERRRNELLVDLEKNLSLCNTVDFTEDYAKQALDQFKMIQTRIDNFHKLLTDKLVPGELTYGRFYVAAEQLYLAVLDNLQGIVTRLRSISTIDPEYIDARLTALNRLKQPAPADREEVDTLKQRQTLRREQLDRVNEMLTFNEVALTEFDRTGTAIADMKTSKGRTNIDLEAATKEIEALAKRAQQF
jgi:hypothetical protein